MRRSAHGIVQHHTKSGRQSWLALRRPCTPPALLLTGCLPERPVQLSDKPGSAVLVWAGNTVRARGMEAVRWRWDRSPRRHSTSDTSFACSPGLAKQSVALDLPSTAGAAQNVADPMPWNPWGKIPRAGPPDALPNSSVSAKKKG